MIVLPRLAITLANEADPETKKGLALDFAEHVVVNCGLDFERAAARQVLDRARPFLAGSAPFAEVAEAHQQLFDIMYSKDQNNPSLFRSNPLLWLVNTALNVACLPELKEAGLLAPSVRQPTIEQMARDAQHRAAHAIVGQEDRKRRWKVALWEEARWQISRTIESTPIP